ncbi:MAG: hypothetical protein GXX96_23330 [Planctomycetaceae bacterium]|nr:hypothetical protein [Planctomycetaceae bacterium]
MPSPSCSDCMRQNRQFSRTLSIVLATLLCSIGARPAPAQSIGGNAELQARVQTLEARTEALQRELDSLRNGPIPLPPVGDTVPAGVSLDTMRAEMSKLTWKKGGFTITPYGRVVVSAVYETERSYPGDIILWAQSPDVQGEDAFYVDAKTTRLGLKIGGPSPNCCPCAALGACVEIDFQGQYLTHNKPGLLFRRGFIDMKDDDFYLLAGQEWEVISPLYPGNLNYVPGSGVGNLGYRRAQIRGDRYFKTPGGQKLSLQGSLNMDILQDFTTDTSVQADVAGWPVLEGRAAWQFARGLTEGAKPAEIGASAHIGEVVYDFLAPNPNPADDVTRRTWSFNVDVNVPITERLSFRSEFFTGENLSAYMGGILQGVDKQTRRSIRSTGGWFDFGYKWTPRLRSYAGYSIDDPFDQDLTSGRTYNHFYFANLLYDVTDKFMVGVDVSSWKTLWIDRRPGDLVRFDFQAQYNF